MEGNFMRLPSGHQRKGQLNLLILLLMLAIVAAIMLFLLSTASGVSQREYMNLYTSNLLLSMMRSDTGEQTPCKTFSDTLACAFVSPGLKCGGSGPTCNQLAEGKIAAYMPEFEQLKGYRYLLAVEPEDFVTLTDEGLYSIEYGDKSLRDLRGERFVATGKIQRPSSTGQQTLSITLIVAK